MEEGAYSVPEARELTTKTFRANLVYGIAKRGDDLMNDRVSKRSVMFKLPDQVADVLARLPW